MFAKDTGSKTLLDINELLQEVVVLLRAEFNMQNVVVALDLTENLPQVLADRVQILQVILNLMINAIDATSAVTNRERRLRIRSEPNCATGVTISLEDTGMGVDPKNINRIFESFFTTKPQGMGMGLSICRSIVEAHNGRLWVESVIGKGSVFRISLPIGG
jgi:signal transduction histidine kinase